jgi:predicted naringenin-chalcone synthase
VKPSASHVLAIATAVPAHVCTQEQSIGIAAQVFAEQPEARLFVERLIRASGIDQRHTVLADYGVAPDERSFFPPTPDFRPEPGTQARNDVFNREAPALALRCCESLPTTDWRGRVTHLITASCTGFGAPGFDVALARALALSPRVHRTHVGFMGCYAGFTTLKLADTICRAEPAALVLIVHVELCSLHVHFRADPNALIANSLFADGAAAALVGGDKHLALAPGQTAGGTWLTVLGSGAFLLPNGEADMTWTLGDQGFDMALSPRVPHLLHKHLAPAFAALLDAVGARREEVRHWAIHPGGPAILDHAKAALGIDETAVALARALLAQYGNMSSATLWFLLDRIRRVPQAGLVYACGFGPGLTLESALLSHPGLSR